LRSAIFSGARAGCFDDFLDIADFAPGKGDNKKAKADAEAEFFHECLLLDEPPGI
jgi:hypothetical protein